MAAERDAYFTPDATALACVRALYDSHPELQGSPVVEPSAGAGAFLRALDTVGKSGRTVAYDIHPMADGIVQANYLEDTIEPFEPGTVVIGNPPYGYRQQDTVAFIKRSFELGAEMVAFLLMANCIGYPTLKRFGREVIGWWGVDQKCFILEDGSPSSMNESVAFIVLGRGSLQEEVDGPWKKLKEETWSEATFSSSIWKARGEIDFRRPQSRRTTDTVYNHILPNGKQASEFLYSGPIPDFHPGRKWWLWSKMMNPSARSLNWLEVYGPELYRGVLYCR